MATVKPLLRDAKFETKEKIPINRVVEINSEGLLVLAASGSIAYGIEEEVAASGEYGTIIEQGWIKATCAETIEPGERVASTAEGKVKKWASTQYVLGVAREKGESGTVISIITPGPAKA